MTDENGVCQAKAGHEKDTYHPLASYSEISRVKFHAY